MATKTPVKRARSYVSPMAGGIQKMRAFPTQMANGLTNKELDEWRKPIPGRKLSVAPKKAAPVKKAPVKKVNATFTKLKKK